MIVHHHRHRWEQRGGQRGALRAGRRSIGDDCLAGRGGGTLARRGRRASGRGGRVSPVEEAPPNVTTRHFAAGLPICVESLGRPIGNSFALLLVPVLSRDGATGTPRAWGNTLTSTLTPQAHPHRRLRRHRRAAATPPRTLPAAGTGRPAAPPGTPGRAWVRSAGGVPTGSACRAGLVGAAAVRRTRGWSRLDGRAADPARAANLTWCRRTSR